MGRVPAHVQAPVSMQQLLLAFSPQTIFSISFNALSAAESMSTELDSSLWLSWVCDARVSIRFSFSLRDEANKSDAEDHTNKSDVTEDDEAGRFT